MGVNRLKVVIPNHEMNPLCARDCNPSLNFNRMCDGSCFQICPLQCQIFSFPQDSFPPIPSLIIHDPVIRTRTTTQTHIVSIIIGITASLLVSAIICILLCFLKKLRREERERIPPVFFGTQQDIINEDQRPEVENPYWYINTVGLQQSVIDSIAVFKYKKDEMVIEGTDCSVCLGEFEEDDSLKLLPKCSHAFHGSCIDTWLRSHKNCPLCRAPIVSTNFGAREVSLVLTPTSSNGSEVESSETRNEGNLMEQEDETNCTNLETKLSISSVTRSKSLNIENYGATRSQSQRLQLKDSRRPISVKRSFSSTAKYPTYSLSMRHSESLPL